MAMTRIVRNHHSRHAPEVGRASGDPKPARFDWPLAYEAEKLLRGRIDDFLARNSVAGELAARVRAETGTDFFEWVDHLVLSPDEEAGWVEAGFVRDAQAETLPGEIVLEHPRTTLPRVLLRGARPGSAAIAIKPEFVADFIAAHNLSANPQGEPGSRYRRVVVAEEN